MSNELLYNDQELDITYMSRLGFDIQAHDFQTISSKETSFPV